ncbi:MAG TPA: hypothetical protein PLP21_05625 [Pyrinomonadaceae bacterium]|nr:hypothetical protein [Acidobacteriota bacterium]HQZ95776.1 hypothetical protein [Pyrinomonadaceae bacterium]
MNAIQFVPGAIDAGGCVSNAWDMLKKNYGMYLGIAIVAMLLTGCIPCLNIFIMGPIMGGVFFVALRDMRGEPVDFGMMFKGFEKFVPLMVIGLIQSIPGVIAQILRFTIDIGQIGLGGKNGDYQFFQSGDNSVLAGGLALIGVVVGLVFMVIAIVWWMIMFFAIPLAMENEIGPIDAIKLSARAAMSNIGGLFVLMIFEILVMLVGVLMICVGAFLISFPLILIANVFAFRQVFPWAGQQFNMAPPPPNAYGSSFGSGM